MSQEVEIWGSPRPVKVQTPDERLDTAVRDIAEIVRRMAVGQQVSVFRVPYVPGGPLLPLFRVAITNEED